MFQVYDSLVDDILINLAEYKALSEKEDNPGYNSSSGFGQ